MITHYRQPADLHIGARVTVRGHPGRVVWLDYWRGFAEVHGVHVQLDGQTWASCYDPDNVRQIWTETEAVL